MDLWTVFWVLVSFIQTLFASAGTLLFWANSAGLVVYRKLVDSVDFFRHDIRGKVVFITGCDSGFGYGVAQSLDKLGAVVFANCLTEQGAKGLAETCSKRLTTLVFDVTDDSALEKNVAKIAEALDGKPLYAVINNAGIDDGLFVEGTSLQQMRKVMEINFFATVSVCKKTLPLLMRKFPGAPVSISRIINVASIAGRVAAPDMAIYSASKHAVEGFTDSLRREIITSGVQVSIIEPGFFKTPIVTNEKRPKLYAELPKELQERYPRELQKIRKNIISISENPQVVVDELVRNVQAKWPILRSLVGVQALWILSIIAAAPTSFYDSVVTVNLFLKKLQKSSK